MRKEDESIAVDIKFSILKIFQRANLLTFENQKMHCRTASSMCGPLYAKKINSKDDYVYGHNLD